MLDSHLLGEEIAVRKNYNPNLIKIFFRYYPMVAKDIDYNIRSDDEDYDIELTHSKTPSNYKLDKLSKYKQIRMISQ